MASWFVRPEQTTLQLSDEQWIVIKRRLNAGEQRILVERSWHDIPDAEGKFHVNPTRAGQALVVAYLIDWSLTDDAGEPVAVRGLPAEELERLLDNLEPSRFTEIRKAIDTHAEAIFQAREAEKKRTAGVNASSTISTWPAAVTGAMSG